MRKTPGNNPLFQVYTPHLQFDIVKKVWTSMLEKCPHSYYLSWPWTEIWIKSLPHDSNLSLVVGYMNETPVIAFFLGSKTITRYGFMKFYQVALNETLIPYIDRATYIEYNAILIDPDITISLESLLDLLPIRTWDEFRMIRCGPSYQPNLILNDNIYKKYNLTLSKHHSYYVNLEKIRRNNNDYFALLSQNRRKQIQRSIKEYEKIGRIQIQIAENVNQALGIFDELIYLHQKRWTERGYPGAFSTEYFREFHKTLITKRLEHGEIQLMKITAGDHTIGCAYNLVYNKEVHASSGGYNYQPSNFYLPGYVCDYFGIMHNATIGFRSYDFLQGENAYKKSLSTDNNETYTLIIHKKGLKYLAERILAKFHLLFNKYRGL